MGKRPKGRPKPRKGVEVPTKRKIKADPTLWSKQSKQSYSYYDTKEYEDIEYVCWRCKKPDVFSAEDQKHSYEVKKNYFWQRRILCRTCWMEGNEIRESLAAHQGQWNAAKAHLKKDKTFLSSWLELLLSLEEYVPYRADKAKKAMITKLLQGNT